MTFGICLKHFDTRYLVFYNTSPPRMVLSLRRLVSWINHFPPARWSTFWKSNFKQQLGCRLMDNESYFLSFDICNYICLDTSDHFSVLPS